MHEGPKVSEKEEGQDGAVVVVRARGSAMAKNEI